MRKIITAQFIVLLIGTVFAWSNFFIELSDWMANRACTAGCAAGIINPFYTPCFFGAIFFTIAFILSMLLMRKK